MFKKFFATLLKKVKVMHFCCLLKNILLNDVNSRNAFQQVFYLVYNMTKRLVRELIAKLKRNA